MCLAPPNMHSVDGVACKSCPAGKEPHKNRTGCASCTTDGPSFMSANGAPCVQCAPGSQPNAARTSCVPCNTVHNDSFWYSNDGAECQRCNPGSASNAQRTSCVQCVGSFPPPVINVCHALVEASLPPPRRPSTALRAHSWAPNTFLPPGVLVLSVAMANSATQ